MIDFANHKMEAVMQRILEVRYTDLTEELELCQQLLAWALPRADFYGKAFALTYLGDYYVAIYDEENAGKYLGEAESLLGDGQCWYHLRLRLHSLLGLYFDMRADEQNSIEHYLKAIAVAQKLQDAEGECMVLNNLAFLFQRYHCYEEALKYYARAYEMKEALTRGAVRATLLGNLADILLAMRRVEEAKKYMEECENTDNDPVLKVIQSHKNWCGYYAALGEKDKAVQHAKLLRPYKTAINKDKLTAFAVYHTLCDNMMELGNAEDAEFFLRAMEEIGACGGLNRMKVLEEAQIRYTILFQPHSLHKAAYHHFYEANQTYREKMTETITDAMKSQIVLDELVQQAEHMQTQQKVLEQEVNRDELTGVYNRKFLEAMMRESADGQTVGNLGVVFLDIDFFKEFNDYYGHIKGDAVLQEIASCLMQCGQEGIYPCRYGGDEFVCLSSGLAEEEVLAYIKRVRASLQSKALPHEKSFCSSVVTLSIGYAVGMGSAQMETHSLFQLADGALYQSKRNGRNTYSKAEAAAL